MFLSALAGAQLHHFIGSIIHLNPAQMHAKYAVNGLKLAAFQPHCENTCLQGLQPGPIQTGQMAHHDFKKKRDCTIYVVKAKAVISCAVTDLRLCFHICKKRVL